ncbi:hypothetical protein PHLGIDRAFT_356078 [Phlebiopsis gigantea 11061_1 CR5-6]|uniref:Uncharacterized protein n=1 Tax=Phlebiopsis gigantea (strain 11061_1 CR5-6) TaxID=745531 RepID=A0A0C3NAC0_PHLG1|nr:hypothetical protein PHLGIDRAFT_356078 [Phlebiopsis gigantea 11061_1 CR5-6]
MMTVGIAGSVTRWSLSCPMVSSLVYSAPPPPNSRALDFSKFALPSFHGRPRYLSPIYKEAARASRICRGPGIFPLPCSRPFAAVEDTRRSRHTR